MSSEDRHVRSIVLYEGMVDWIMERATPEERLAAWDTLVAVAFPEDVGDVYEPPKAKHGSPLSAIDRTKRDAYNIFKGIAIRSSVNTETQTFSSAEESTVGGTDSFGSDQIEPIYFRPTRGRVKLTEADKEQIAEWNRKFPDAKALYDYLNKSYFYQNRSLVCSEEFCKYALCQFQMSNWIFYKTRTPYKTIDKAIHYMALDYKRKCGEIRRSEEEERRKDMESEFEAKAMQYGQQDSTDIATAERKRRIAAEERWMQKLMEEHK